MFYKHFCSVVMQNKMLNNIPFVFTTVCSSDEILFLLSNADILSL